MDQKTEAKKTRAEEVAQIQQHIFEREVDEELRQERLTKLWKKYRFLVYGGVIGVIAATIGVEWYQSWKIKVRQVESDLLESAVVLSVQGKEKQALEIFKSLGVKGKTGYRFIAQMEEAGVLLKQKKNKEAFAVLKKLSENKAAPKAIRDVALLSYVGHQVDSKNAAKMVQLLDPLVQDKTSPFYGQAVELSVSLRLKSGEKKKANEILQEALKDQNITPQVRERLTVLSEQDKS